MKTEINFILYKGDYKPYHDTVEEVQFKGVEGRELHRLNKGCCPRCNGNIGYIWMCSLKKTMVWFCKEQSCLKKDSEISKLRDRIEWKEEQNKKIAEINSQLSAKERQPLIDTVEDAQRLHKLLMQK